MQSTEPTAAPSFDWEPIPATTTLSTPLPTLVQPMPPLRSALTTSCPLCRIYTDPSMAPCYQFLRACRGRAWWNSRETRGVPRMNRGVRRKREHKLELSLSLDPSRRTCNFYPVFNSREPTHPSAGDPYSFIDARTKFRSLRSSHKVSTPAGITSVKRQYPPRLLPARRRASTFWLAW